MARVESCPRCREDVSVPSNFISGQLRCGECQTVFEVGDSARERDSLERFRDRPDEDRRNWRDRDEPDEPWLRALRRDSQRAKEKVQGPGVLMIVVGALLVLGALGSWGFLCFLHMSTPNDPDLIPMTFVFALGGLFAFVSGAVNIFAGMRLRALRSYGLAMAATVLIMVVGTLTCQPLALVAIWPLIVLMDAEVKNAFRQIEEEGRFT